MAAGVAVDPFVQQLGVSQDTGQRIVDLMCQHGSHLADGGHFLGVQGMLVGALELASLLLDTLLESMSPGKILLARSLQLAAHAVERAGEFANLVVRLNVDLIAKVAGRKALGSSLERLHRLANDSPDKEPTENSDQ